MLISNNLKVSPEGFCLVLIGTNPVLLDFLGKSFLPHRCHQIVIIPLQNFHLTHLRFRSPMEDIHHLY